IQQGFEPLRNLQVADVPGNGLKTQVNGDEILIGKPGFVGEEEAYAFEGGILANLANQGKTVTFVRDEHGILAAMALKDTVRDIT
ncbi:hypothetical protein, partial [Tritonibacter sp. SIMBA_163]|uniref:hypothetical protein n=1 Tax=Tritonibacter sp. SIMBA_163 TaxID=3080868 RepID=UPI0039810954